MIISEAWVREWAAPKIDTDELCEKLTMAGLEVASSNAVVGKLSKVVTGEILQADTHPGSAYLQVCRVDVGRARPLKIVCGAANARKGLKVAVALIGAMLPNGMRIGKTRIRDLVSSGMLCSAAELGFEDVSDGILELDTDAPVGMDLHDHLRLDDQMIEIELTPNRGDCLSILGVAREVATITGCRLKAVNFKTIAADTQKIFPVKVEAKSDCPRFTARVIEGINMRAPTPDWMREKLRRCGVRSINAIVDITNYVMLELGQPMHAFDFDKLQGGIIVRHARPNETLQLLDGSELSAKSGTLFIADHNKAVALGGIMGGNDSAIGDLTVNVLLEAAFFNPDTIAGKAREYGLHTDASHRFERGVDFENQVRAIERATDLIKSIAGGHCGPVIESKNNRHLPTHQSIILRHERIERILGQGIPARRVETILKRLGFIVNTKKKYLQVITPGWRPDVSGEHDLIEEIGRVFGYDNLPFRLPRPNLSGTLAGEAQISEQRIRHVLIDRDYHEAISYSFVDSELQSKLHPGQNAIELANPIASNMNVMRVSQWTGLLQILANNLNRQHKRVRLFEIGHVFAKHKNSVLAKEVMMLSGVVSGPVVPTQWGLDDRLVDFFDVKGDLENLLAIGGNSVAYRFIQANHSALHSGQCADIFKGKQKIGVIGVLHPRHRKAFDIAQNVVLFELQMSVLLDGKIPGFLPISRYPATRRDLSILIDQSIPSKIILDCVREAAGPVLTKLELFDEYRGENIDSMRKSLAFGLTLQETSRTLRDEEVESIMARVMSSLEKNFKAQLRN